MYQSPWEPMANCIVAFDIRQVSGNATEVAYRSIHGGPTTDAGGDARDIADRCARP